MTWLIIFYMSFASYTGRTAWRLDTEQEPGGIKVLGCVVVGAFWLFILLAGLIVMALEAIERNA